MNYLELGFDSFGIRSIIQSTRQSTQEYRNSVPFGDVSATSIYVGSGNEVMKADSNGLYIGNEKFADAPFSVALDGRTTITDSVMTIEKLTVVPVDGETDTVLVKKPDGTQLFVVDTTNGWIQIGDEIPPTNNDPQVTLYLTKDTNLYYAGFNMQNINSGEYASTDMIILNDENNAQSYQLGLASGYIDIGVNSSGWNDPTYGAFDASAEFFDVGNNLYIGTSGTDHSIFFYLGGRDSKDYIRVQINKDGVLIPYKTSVVPTYVEGGLYYDTVTHKLHVGGQTGWEEVTSSVVPSASISPSASPSSSLSPSISPSGSPSSSRSPSLSPSLSPSISPSPSA